MGTMLYNGVELPDIETVWTDKEAYPYAVLEGNGEPLNTVLWMFESLPTMEDDHFFVSSCKYSSLAKSLTWNSPGSQSIFSLSYTNVFWSSFDVLKSDGTLYLSASDPVDPNAPTVDPARRLKSLINGLLCGLVTPGRLGRTPVAYSYNGAVLPKLPEHYSSLEDYPYSLVCGPYTRDGYDGAAYMYIGCKIQPTYNGETVKIKNGFTPSGGGGSYYVTGLATTAELAESLNASGILWNDAYDVFGINAWGDGSSFYGLYEKRVDKVIWTNTDIYHETDGSLYLAASEPIPVYE